MKELKNRLIIKDDDGNIIVDRTNLVVNSGRIFTLERCSNLPYSVEGYSRTLENVDENLSLLDRELVVFQLGQIGALTDLTESPAVLPTNTDIGTTIPLIGTTVGATHSQNKYFNNVLNSGTYSFTAKSLTFAWDTDFPNNLVSLKASFTISALDAIDQWFNSIGFYVGNKVITSGSLVDIRNLELFSKITFPPILKTNFIDTNFSLEYYIYG